MPIYEYYCSNCGSKFETIRSMKDADKPINCTKCQSLSTHRALSKCNTHGDGHSSGGSSGGCGSCTGGSCASCGH